MNIFFWITSSLLSILIWMPDFISFGPFSISFLAVLLLPVVCVFGVHRGVRVGGRMSSGFVVELLCAFTIIVFSFTSAINSPEPERVMRVIIPMTYALSVYIFINISNDEIRTKFLEVFIVAGFVVLLSSIVLAYATPFRRMVMGAYRLKSFFDNANQLSIVIASIVPFALVHCFHRVGRKRLFAIAVLTIFLAALMLTGGKTAIGLSLVGIMAVMILRASTSGFDILTLFRVLLALFLGFVVLVASIPIIKIVSPITYMKFAQIFGGGIENYQSIVSRSVVWQEAIRLGLEHPILGSGAGAHIFGLTHAHNMILDYFRGGGVFAAVAAIVLTITTIVRSTRAILLRSIRNDQIKRLEASALLVGGCLYLIANQLSDSFSPSTAAFFWITYMIGLTHALSDGRRVQSKGWVVPSRKVVRQRAP